MAVMKQLAIEASVILQSLEESERNTIQQIAAIACWSLLEHPKEIAQHFSLGNIQAARLFVLASVVADSKLHFGEQTRVVPSEMRQPGAKRSDNIPTI